MKTHFFNLPYIFTALIFAIVSNANAQPPLTEYYPVGTSWEEVITSINYPNEFIDKPILFRRVQSDITGDTIVDGKKYKIVQCVMTEDLESPSNVGWVFKTYYIRESGDSIFYRHVLGGSMKDALDYVFNWNDSVLICYGQSVPIDYPELEFSQEQLSDGNYYDCCTVKYLYPPRKFYKSIGMDTGGLLLMEISRTPIRSRLSKFSRNGVLIYEKDYYTPQVVKVNHISADTETASQNHFSLQGVKLDRDHLRPGIYINKGKKIVIK